MRQHEARAAAEQVYGAERELEAGRRHAMHLMTLAGNARTYIVQGEESLAALEREAERLAAEMGQAQGEHERLGSESQETRLRFESAESSIRRLEEEIAALRVSLQTKRADEQARRAAANQLRSDRAAAEGRRDSLQALIRNHGYATDTVRKLLKPGALGQSVAPVGTLADFIEVSGEHEGIVDEFLREELNYVVVENWGAAEEGVRVLKTSDGRATFLVHSDLQGELFASNEGPINEPGITPLRDAIKVLNGFGHSIEGLLPKLKNGYLVESEIDAKKLALRYGHAYFLTPEGECFHRSTVTGGKPASEGPLALKRELRVTETRLETLERELAQAENEAETLTREIAALTTQLETLGEERRHAENDAANLGAALKQMEAETQRIAAAARGVAGAGGTQQRCARAPSSASIAEKRGEAARLDAEHSQAESSLDAQQAQLESLRQTRDLLQQEAAQMTAELAGLEERRRGAEAAFQRIDRALRRSRAARADHRAAARGRDRRAGAADCRERDTGRAAKGSDRSSGVGVGSRTVDR